MARPISSDILPKRTEKVRSGVNNVKKAAIATVRTDAENLTLKCEFSFAK